MYQTIRMFLKMNCKLQHFGLSRTLRTKAHKNNVTFVILTVILSFVFFPHFTESRNALRKSRSPHEQRDPVVIDSKSEEGTFRIYWNSPTFQCKSRNIHFTHITKNYGISQNTEDSFRGNKIALLYDPGFFSALLKNGSQPGYVYRNGGIPQDGNLSLHLERFEKDLDILIPDELFNGLAIIDFESWRPVFRQNWASLQPYKDISYEIEKKKHPLWSQSWIEKEATKLFEEAGKKFVEDTIALARKKRPMASWGYYAYPYCFNMNMDTKVPKCSDQVRKENDRMQWLWDESDLLLPSVYLSEDGMTSAERMQLIRGRVEEAKRLQGRTKGHKSIYPYMWYKYRDTDNFMTKEDLYEALSYIKNSGLDGVIMWGSSNDVNTKEKCLRLQEYVDNVLGPVVREFVHLGKHRGGVEAVQDSISDSDKIENPMTENANNTTLEIGNVLIEKLKHTIIEAMIDDVLTLDSNTDVSMEDVNIPVVKEILFDSGPLNIIYEEPLESAAPMKSYQDDDTNETMDTIYLDRPENMKHEQLYSNHQEPVIQIKTRAFGLTAPFSTVFGDRYGRR